LTNRTFKISERLLNRNAESAFKRHLKRNEWSSVYKENLGILADFFVIPFIRLTNFFYDDVILLVF